MEKLVQEIDGETFDILTLRMLWQIINDEAREQ